MLKRLKKSVITLFDRLGYKWIPKWAIEKYPISEHLKKIVKYYQIDCIIDVGANIGQYRDFLRNHVGYDKTIISIEPDPECFNILKKKCKNDNKWHVENYALSNKNCVLKMNIMSDRVFNSFLEPDNTKTNQFESRNSIEKNFSVNARRLDSVFTKLRDQYHFSKCFLKLDTQGYDLNVLDGAKEIMGFIHGVQTEVSFQAIYKKMPLFEETHKAFRSNQFKISGLYPVDSSQFPHAVEYDCIYLIAPHPPKAGPNL